MPSSHCAVTVMQLVHHFGRSFKGEQAQEPHLIDKLSSLNKTGLCHAEWSVWNWLRYLCELSRSIRLMISVRVVSMAIG